MMPRKKAFTLIELLVVIAIIALLMSVLVPSLRKAKEQARFIICKTNLHSYGLAGSMYLQDNNNAFPHPIVCVDGPETFESAYLAEHPKECRWHDAGVEPTGVFWPYLEEQGVNSCPSFLSVAKKRGLTHPWHNTTLDIPIVPRNTYSMNGFLGKGGMVGDHYDDLLGRNGSKQMPKLTNVKQTSGVLFVTEENIWVVHVNNGDEISLSTDALNDMYFAPGKYGNGDCIATFHKAKDSELNTGFSNVLFLDGHVDQKKAYDEDDLRVKYSNKSLELARRK
jgi:prepilin-type N-terminal cleavage/methylation domain-containing protein/prepilin-type processing-associated H-X9-DG protein